VGEERWDAFISYGHQDAEWVRALAGNLHRDGFDVFLDEWELVGGDRVTGRLEDAIRDATNGVLVVSPHALSRPWVREEYEALLRQAVQDGARRLIPVLYRDAEMPAFMANRLWVDFRGAASTGPEYDARLEELERALHGLPGRDRPVRDGSREWPLGTGGRTVRPAGAMRLSLVVERDRVSLRDDGATELAGGEVRWRPVTEEAIKQLRWLWRGGGAATNRAAADGFDAALALAGRRLSEDSLTGTVGAALANAVAEATALNAVLELGIRAGELGELPWETMLLPEPDGMVPAAGGTALAVHRNVALFRGVAGRGPVAAHKVRGPLRMLVAIASPESQNASGELLNYEAELARILTSVDAARRRGDAHVRVLTEGSLKAISDALIEEPEGFHVVHLSCHARPGELILETPDGAEDPVSAARLLDEGLRAGTSVPMVVLSGCSTGLGTRQQHSSGGDGDGDAHDEGESALASVASELLDAGVPLVLSMQAPVSDLYATQLAGELYEYLASADAPDPLAALSDARRDCERVRQQLPADAPQRARAEWATPALWVREPRLPLFHRREAYGPVIPVSAPVLAEGIVVRKVGEFVGRRRELREARRALDGEDAGLVIHAIGGVGKSTLAAEIIAGAGPDRGVVISRAGALTVDTILEEVSAQLTILLPDADDPVTTSVRQAAQLLRRHDVEWADRQRALTQTILPAVPMIVLLDNFEDNLRPGHQHWTIRDPELAEFLAGWVHRPGESKLIITSHHPFVLPGNAERRLERLHLGPLTPAETAKLMWRLPGLDALPAIDRVRAYHDVGGHPRTLEYLDALLHGGHAKFDDVAQRMEDALSKRGIADPTAWMAVAGRDIDSALAESVTLTVDEIVLSDLLHGLAQTSLARELVVGAAVYRTPIDRTALIWQLADETEAPSDPQRDARLARVQAVIAAARVGVNSPDELTADQLGLTSEELAAYQGDIEALRRPPVAQPDGFDQALSVALSSGLIAPITRSDGGTAYLVHRWTARAINHLEPNVTAGAHRRAARYWRWRLQVRLQIHHDLLNDMLEARYHHHAAGELDASLELTDGAIFLLRTWGQYGRASELCRQTLDWIPADTVKVAIYIHELGMLAQNRGDYATAEKCYTEALEIAERLGDQPGLARGYHQLGMLAELRGDYETAEQRYTESLEIEERLGNETGLATSYEQLGILAARRGEYETAEQRYKQSHEINERLGDEPQLASNHFHLGVLARLRGEYETAEQRFKQSLKIAGWLGDQAELARGYQELGVLAEVRGDYVIAEQRYNQSLEINERLGNQASIAGGYHQLGILAQHHGDYDTAEQRYTQSLEIFERLGDQAGLAGGYHELGMIAQARGNYETAEERYNQSLEINERLGNQASIATNYHQLGMLAHVRGEYETAEQHYNQSLEIEARLGNQAGLARSYYQLGVLGHVRGEYETAEQHYNQSLEINERLGDQASIAAGCAALAVLLVDRDAEQAISYDLRALSIFMQMRDQHAVFSLERLASARSRLGDAGFMRIAAQTLDAASLQTLTELLDQQ
jgi:tetratricopeptide (TPR) repeat protein